MVALDGGRVCTVYVHGGRKIWLEPEFRVRSRVRTIGHEYLMKFN